MRHRGVISEQGLNDLSLEMRSIGTATHLSIQIKGRIFPCPPVNGAQHPVASACPRATTPVLELRLTELQSQGSAPLLRSNFRSQGVPERALAGPSWVLHPLRLWFYGTKVTFEDRGIYGIRLGWIERMADPDRLPHMPVQAVNEERTRLLATGKRQDCRGRSRSRCDSEARLAGCESRLQV